MSTRSVGGALLSQYPRPLRAGRRRQQGAAYSYADSSYAKRDAAGLAARVSKVAVNGKGFVVYSEAGGKRPGNRPRST